MTSRRPAPRSFTWLRALVLLWIGLLAGFAIGVEWIRTRPTPPPAPSGQIDLVGAGATFPYPLYRLWFSQYHERTGVRINYFSVGTGEGVRLLFEEDVDFGATDRPLRPDERARATCGPVELMTVVGAVAVVTNLPEVSVPLRLDASVLGAIFLGRVTRWDDAVLRRLNPGTALPARPIVVVQRDDASGTRAVLDAYLAQDPQWTARANLARAWPSAEAIAGNEGVAGQVRATPGSIGFVELAYAQQSRLAVASMRNRAGSFVRPSVSSLSVAATELLAAPDGDTLSALTAATDAAAYPIAAVTRIVADRVLGDAHRAEHLIAFVRWALREGGPAAESLGYAPLPAPAMRRQLRALESLRAGECPRPRTP